MPFPSPIGGIALPPDFAPSILFAVLYGCLVPLILYRQIHCRSWSILLLGSVGFAVERVVVLSLRASLSHNESLRESKGYLKYMQLTLIAGYIGISQDLAKLVRCILVNPTFGTDTLEQAPAYVGAKRASGGSRLILEEILSHQPILQVVTSEIPIPDVPRVRFWVRRFIDVLNLAYLGALVPGIIAGIDYTSTIENNDKSGNVSTLRYVSAGVALFLNIVQAGVLVWSTTYLKRLNKRASHLVIAVTLLLVIVPVYRLAVLHNMTDSLTSLEPGSLNSGGAKATFYIFHVLPEWLSILLLFGFNTREICGTGPWGDWRGQDKVREQREWTPLGNVTH